LDSFGGKDLKEMKKIGSSPQVHVVVQRDSAADGAHRYYVQKGTTIAQDEIEALGAINTGDPNVLKSFLTWGLAKYPAQRTMAVLWNHGSGWDDTDIYHEADRRGLKPIAPSKSGARRGAGGGATFPVKRAAKVRRFRGPLFITAFEFDETSGNRRAIAFDDGAQDFLDSVELKNVFNAVAKKAKKKFDVIGMDACLMSMVENGVQVQAAGQTFVGSQEVEPGDGWPYDRLLKALQAKPTMDARQLTSVIVKEFVAQYPKSEAVTQSAFDLAGLANVRQAADALGAQLAKAIAPRADLALEGAIERARKQSQRYEHPDYVDLWDFSAQLGSYWPAGAVAIGAVQKAVTDCVFANSAPHAAVKRSHGLSIYLPASELNSLYDKLDFAKGGWAKFLRAYRG
jgi:hypothetical protein